MSKAKVFALNQALEKSLAGYRPTLRYGERIQMYNHLYKVVAFQDKGYTFLEDEKNAKLAFPTNKLRMLMKKGICISVGSVNAIVSLPVDAPDVAKAVRLSGPSAKVGVTPKAINAAYGKKPSAGTGQPRGEPVGTVKNGADGDTYKKTSANPSVWVRVSTGTVHHEAGGDEQDPMSVSPEARQQFQSMMSKIDPKVHPEDRPKIQKKAEEWMKENAKFKHMTAAHNTNEVDQKGQPLPKTGIPAATMTKVYAQGDKARQARQELIDLVKESHLKVKGEANAK